MLSLPCKVLIVAGGVGKRMDSAIPKQFIEIHNKPILFYTINAFIKAIKDIEILIVCHKDYLTECRKITQNYFPNQAIKITEGGVERYHSVQNGLLECGLGTPTLIAIHDAARPLVSIELIQNGFKLAQEKGNAIPILPISQSMRQKDEKGVYQVVDRSRYVTIQTPQIFHSNQLIESYKQTYSNRFTDDATVVEQCGYPLHFFEGNTNNLKITYPEDIDIASVLLTL